MFTSLLSPENLTEQGWWNIISQPSLATLDNYDEVFNTEAITSRSGRRCCISVGGTVLPIFVAAMAGYAFAWLEFPAATGSSSS
jgi:alpha-glucoside transport system permease protein